MRAGTFRIALLFASMIGLIASHAPQWAVIAALAICATFFYETNGISRDLARIQCELNGHWGVEFEKKYQEEARCPRCNEVVRVRALGSDGSGMQFCEDTLHQRISRLEKALQVDEPTA